MIEKGKDSRQSRLGVIILATLGLVLGGAVAFRGIDLQTHVRQRLQPPSEAHVLGTDALGRDLLSCLAFGTLASVAIALAVVVLAAMIGTSAGFLAGWHGGWLGSGIMRLADFILAFPGILLALLLIAFWGQGIVSLVGALALSGWVGFARLVRGEVLRIKKQDFILAARGFNASPARIARDHVLPLVRPLLLTHAVSAIAAVILAEASLNFLGLGLDPRLPTLGGLIDAGHGHIFSRPALVIVPGACLVLLLAGFVLLAEGLATRRAAGDFEK
ncbi:MAG: ABC transporter permease [Candidatus Aminicenantes bacterium]|nr:ABC transporter permease [Candidatus Aminicenantes bacterium]